MGGDTMAANLADATAVEKDAIANYEGLIAAKKKEVEALTGIIEAKTKQIGELGVAIVNLQETSAHLADKNKELMATDKYMASLHAECDWLLKYFDARKEARAGEVDSLTKAKAVLSGADYSFVQTRRHTFLGRVA